MRNQTALYFFGILFSISLLACAGTKSQNSDANQTITRNQLTKYQTMHEFDPVWAEIDSLMQKGLPKSALKKLTEIEPKIRQSNHPGQLIKWVRTKVRVVQNIEENSDWKNYQRYKEEIAKAETPAKQVLQIYLAKYLSQWSRNHRWRIRQRTAIDQSKEEDLRTWSLKKLETETSRLYQAALAEQSLKQFSPSVIAPNVIKGKETDGLRPTLYDLLAHEALSFYMQEQNFLTEPAYEFYIDNADYFAEASVFANKQINSKDLSSRKLAAIHLFQELTKAHLTDANPSALADLELNRLKFVHQNFVGDNKDKLYFDALDRLRKKYADNPISAEVIYNMAQVYILEANQYQPKDPSQKGKDSNLKAVKLLNEAIRNYPDTYGADLCKKELANLKLQSIEIQAEKVYLPMKPGLIRLDYRNVKQVNLKIFKLNNPYELFTIDWNESVKKNLHKQKIVAQKDYTLTTPQDYNQHSTELMMPSLPYGQYYLQVTDNKGVVKATTPFQVSNLTALKLDDDQEGNAFMVLHREDGLPVMRAEIRLFPKKSYRDIDYAHPEISTTNEKGIAKIKINDRKRQSYQVALAKGVDLLMMDNNFYKDYYHPHSPQERSVTNFFLDRAIYRPGQTVYFKALVYTLDADQIPHIKTNKAIAVSLFDANNQKVKTISLNTNEYGTVNGQFQLPSGGMNGYFSIRSDVQGQIGFRVEEYKRPKFEVTIDPPKKAYSVGDVVTVKGLAKNYSAATLDGANVKYVVNRQVQFQYGPRFWSNWYPPSPPTQMAIGKTTTHPDGSFEIQFEALPDRSIDKSTKPNFNYTIQVFVTDVTGETHEATSSVTVGYIALKVNIPLQEKMNVADFKGFKILTKNLNDEFEAAKGSVQLARLKSPYTYFIDRYWERPEYQLLSKTEFKANYPHFAYANEDDQASWETSSVVLEQDFDTQVTDSVEIKSVLPQGYYKLTLQTKDKNGEKIEIIKYVELRGDDGYVFNNLFDFSPIKTSAEPGELAKISLGSTDKVNYLISVFRYKKPRRDETEIIRHQLKMINFPVTEEDRGGFQVKVTAVRDNRFLKRSANIQVPWTNKDLNITYESFREKLHPGQKEKWRIKISGPKADAAAAEVVATMYDASLDAFVRNHWSKSFYPTRYYNGGWDWIENFGAQRDMDIHYTAFRPTHQKIYDAIENMYATPYGLRGDGILRMAKVEGAPPMPVSDMKEESTSAALDLEAEADSQVGGREDKNIIPGEKKKPAPVVSPRANLKETVFFKPDLKTDADGNVIIEFTMNEALTRWKFMTFAHDKEMRFAYSEKEVITQKELMVIPNPPRFLREFDEIEFAAKVVNMSDKDLHPNVELQLLDELHTMPVYKWLDNPQFNKRISVPKGRSTAVSFRFKVPAVSETSLIKWSLIATAGKYSDGESSYLPVITNRMLVTETLPLPVKAKQKRTFDFKAMEKASKSESLENHSFTLEFTANPAWYAVQALPYIMEYPHECSEQVFSRLYANTLATSVANSHPKIKQVFEKWRTTDTDALASNLSKNKELKSVLLEETPWVMNALSEEEQKKNIGLLFDLDRMAGERDKAIRTLADRQSQDGGFAWFPGGKNSWYITQYIVEGFGHLSQLGALKKKENPQAWKISNKAIQFIDSELLNHYNELAKQVKKGHAKWEDDHLNNMVIHYLYARSFFLSQDLPKDLRKPYSYYLGQAKKYWLGKGIYQEGLIALALQRNNETATAQNIMKSLKERSITNEELGMYWKQNYGYYWYQLPVETNALMIEAFDEIMNDSESVYQLKVWLLKNKQTTHWKTTKATSSAVYALLKSGKNWLLEDQPISIKVGKVNIKPDQTEAGTGYFKQSWDKESIPANASHITVENPNNAIAWGGVYWQYFEDLDQVKIFKETPLQLKKELFRETMSDQGPILNKVKEGEAIHVGDKLKMRIELRVDRAMEYVHMKDMRAAGLEPTNVLSQYKWQDGLGYYESTRDLATDFFFSYLRPGVYVFEYPLTAQLKGNFSNGVTTIQCMYAPEFSSHSEGVRVTIK
ncbi:MAG TPA: hypothetical protein ENK85_03160 [Saprospiraceae bacterium]|nr:hypothetical protein [Saprospiraceae bacterium]